MLGTKGPKFKRNAHKTGHNDSTHFPGFKSKEKWHEWRVHVTLPRHVYRIWFGSWFLMQERFLPMQIVSWQLTADLFMRDQNQWHEGINVICGGFDRGSRIAVVAKGIKPRAWRLNSMPCPVSRFRTNENVAKGLSRENITRTRYQEFAREKKLSDMTISEMIRKSSSFLCALCHSNRKGKLLELCYHYNFKKKNPNHSQRWIRYQKSL